MPYPLIAVKLWRTLRQVPRQTLLSWRDAFLNEGQFLSLSLAAYTSWIGLQTATLPEIVEEANGWINAIQATIYVSAGWAAICLIRAPFTVRRTEQHKGQWDSHRFTYHEPKLIATARLEHKDGVTQAIPLDVRDFERGAMVYITAETTPAVDSRVIVMPVSGAPIHDYEVKFGTKPGGYAGTRVSTTDGNLTLYVKIKPETVPLTLRVYCNQFYIGKDDQSYT